MHGRVSAYRRSQAPDRRLHVHVHADRDNIHVSGSLAVSEQRSLDTVCSGKDTHLCIGNAAAAVIVRMKGKNDIIAVFQVFAHVFHLACINVRHGKLTVLGRLMMALRSAVGCHTSRTALHTSSAYSGSVPVKLSGLYSKRYFSPASSVSSFKSFAPSTAIFRMSSFDFLKTC